MGPKRVSDCQRNNRGMKKGKRIKEQKQISPEDASNFQANSDARKRSVPSMPCVSKEEHAEELDAKQTAAEVATAEVPTAAVPTAALLAAAASKGTGKG